jgi:predicted nucleotidyltransferase
MPIYTVVTEGYDVEVYRTRKALLESLESNGLCLETFGDDEPVVATSAQIAKAIREDSIVRLYPEDGGDWTHRIMRHD